MSWFPCITQDDSSDEESSDEENPLIAAAAEASSDDEEVSEEEDTPSAPTSAFSLASSQFTTSHWPDWLPSLLVSPAKRKAEESAEPAALKKHKIVDSNSPECATLWIGNVPWSMDAAGFENHFGQFGKLISARLVTGASSCDPQVRPGFG